MGVSGSHSSVSTMQTKAVLKPPQSKRWRVCPMSMILAKRLDCGGFSTAFPMEPGAATRTNPQLSQERTHGRTLPRTNLSDVCRSR